jgi:hypothetical protein
LHVAVLAHALRIEMNAGHAGIHHAAGATDEGWVVWKVVHGERVPFGGEAGQGEGTLFPIAYAAYWLFAGLPGTIMRCE